MDIRVVETVLDCAGFVLVIVGAFIVLSEVRRTDRALEAVVITAQGEPTGEETHDQYMQRIMGDSGVHATLAIGKLAEMLGSPSRRLERLGVSIAVAGGIAALTANLLGVWVH